MTNQEFLEKLQREIESHIDAHRRENDASFNKLRQKVAIAFSGMADGEQQQFQPRPLATRPMRPLPDNVWDESTSQVWNQESGESLFDLCCTNSMFEEGKVEYYDIENEREEPSVLCVPQAGLSDPSALRVPASSFVIHPTDDMGTPTPASPDPRRSIDMGTLELKPANRGEFSNRQLGQAKGEFEGRTNLWAFLQTKEWDSVLAQHPLEKIEISEVENHASSPLGPVVGKKLKSIVHSFGFDLIIGIVILANIVVMGVTLEFEGIHSANSIGVKSDDSATAWPNAQDAFDALEHIFTMIYLVELILRVATDGSMYFYSALNWVDFTIVVIGLVELYIIPLIGTETPVDLRLIRLMRVFRIFRVLRMVRLLKLLPRLRALVVAVSNSIWSLIWAVVLLAIYMIFAAVFMTQSLQNYFLDETADLALRQQVYQYFGNFTRSLITMFEITLSMGTWGRCGRVVIFSVNRWYALFFLGYMGYVSFALIRVIAALFLKDTLASSEKASVAAMAENNKDPLYVKRIYNIFKTMDYDDDGNIQFAELQVAVQDPKVLAELEGLGVASHEVLGLFTLMDDGDDEISFCEFISGMMRLKNIGRGVDLATLLYENKKLLKRVLGVGNEVAALKKICLARS